MAELVYAPVVAVARAAFLGWGLRFDIEGARRIPARGPVILAANHVSLLDFLFVGLAARGSGRYVRFVTMAEAFRHPVAGALLRGMRHIPVDRGRTESRAGAYRFAERALAGGEAVGIFPEGRLGPDGDGTPLPFRRGAVRLAQATGAMLLPVGLSGGQELLTGVHRDLTRRGVPIGIRLGEPVRPAPDADPDEAGETLRRAVAALARDAAGACARLGALAARTGAGARPADRTASG